MELIMKIIKHEAYSNTIAILFSLCLMSSCGVVQIGGLTSGYNSLTNEQKQHVKHYASSANAETGVVYKVSAEQIKDCIKKEKNVLVYDFTPWCRGERCINPMQLGYYCKNKGLSLYVIANAYDNLLDYDLQAMRYFVIDEETCGTKRRDKYIRVFYDELTQVEERIRGHGSYLLFKEGVFQQAFDTIDDLVIVKK